MHVMLVFGYAEHINAKNKQAKYLGFYFSLAFTLQFQGSKNPGKGFSTLQNHFPFCLWGREPSCRAIQNELRVSQSEGRSPSMGNCCSHDITYRTSGHAIHFRITALRKHYMYLNLSLTNSEVSTY